ncbi:family 14 glycosylhydrolase [Paenibacillus sp. SI8]|uniref:family 14 glycosylhydrolase n=1 Tax=unclassified Paenibacillus TaxID=185978 RepID=UPI0034662BBC
MYVHNTKNMKSYKLIIALLITALLFFGSALNAPAAKASSDTSNTKIVVMLNLADVTDFNAFDRQMATLKSSGVYGVEVDMWWNHFEPTQGNYDWNYYDTLFTHIQNAGLKISPIFSFHQCGGNVGDTCYYPIPDWVWSLGTAEEMQFKSESGYYDKQYIAPWFTQANDLYDGAFKSFATHMSKFKSSIEKLHIGLGPAGELRYPSYNFNDSVKPWAYPSRGLFQASSTGAIQAFQTSMQQKYTTIAQLNTAWGTSLADFTEVKPPVNGDVFYSSGDYSKPYGVDFLTWYQSVLTDHFTDIVTKAHTDLDTTFGVHLSAKIPGIHWQYSNPAAPHSAEHATGLYDYAAIVDKYKASNVDLTFTMLEMTNAGNGNGTSPNFSKPEDLIDDVATLAEQKGIELEGENALSIGSAEGYLPAYQELTRHNFKTFTLLRLQDVVRPNGQPTNLLTPFIAVIKTGVIPEKPSQSVTFNVYDANANPSGETVYIVGNNAAIGNWTPANAIPGIYVGNGYWHVNTTLKATETYNFKAIKKDASGNVNWEQGSDHSWTVPNVPGGVAQFKADWRAVGENSSHSHYITGDVDLNGSSQVGTTVSLLDRDGNTVLSAVYGEQKQSVNGIYGVTSPTNDSTKVRYFFSVPVGTYTLQVVNGKHSVQITVDANSQTTATVTDATYYNDNVPVLQLPGDPFKITKNSFSTSGGVSASVNVAPTPFGASISNKVVIFMLMNGTTPAGINAVGSTGSAAQDVSTYFNVPSGNYTLRVFVVDSYDISSTTNLGNNLAEPLVIQN